MCKGPFNCAKKVVGRYGLGQKVIRTRLDGPHRGRDVGMAGEEYDRQCRTEFAQPRLAAPDRSVPVSARRGECSSGYFRSASDPASAGRSIGRHVVTGVLQTTFHRRPEGRIVVDNVHEPLHVSLPREGPYGIKQLQPLGSINFIAYDRLSDLNLSGRLLGFQGSPRGRRARWVTRSTRVKLVVVRQPVADPATAPVGQARRGRRRARPARRRQRRSCGSSPRTSLTIRLYAFQAPDLGSFILGATACLCMRREAGQTCFQRWL